jgi:hypothetical protein
VPDFTEPSDAAADEAIETVSAPASVDRSARKRAAMPPVGPDLHRRLSNVLAFSESSPLPAFDLSSSGVQRSEGDVPVSVIFTQPVNIDATGALSSAESENAFVRPLSDCADEARQAAGNMLPRSVDSDDALIAADKASTEGVVARASAGVNV